MSAQVSYKKQIAFFLILSALLLFAVEIGVRIIETPYEPCTFIGKDALKNVEEIKQNQICEDNNSTLYELDGILKYVPNQNMETISINSHGFRGDDFSEKKDLDTYRIFIVGGSTTFGGGTTSDDTTMPSFLQKKFDVTNSDKKIEILNAGIGSAYSYSEKYLIENDLMKFQPDLIIIYSGGNDANNRYGVEYTVPGISISQLTQYVEQTDFVGLVKKFIKEIDYRSPFVLMKIYNGIEQNFTPSESAKNQVQELWTTRMGEICKTNNDVGIKTIILVQPMLGSGNKQLSTDEKILLENYGTYMEDTLYILNKIAGSLVELENICHETYDLRMIFDDVKEPLLFDHMHVTDLGNEIVAEEIYEILINQL
tara:strand:- start:28 stop:1134 length:1107 start_codon:yes stop_codon:yes gene_type:complete